jgi:hypothetical protein
MVARLFTDITPAVQALFADGQASGEFRDNFDPQAAATAIMALIDAVPPRMARDPAGHPRI